MTEFSFSESLSLANAFSVKLLSGMLNVRSDYSAEGCPLVEVTHTTESFTTERIAGLRAATFGSRPSVLEASETEDDIFSTSGRGEVRHITIYTRDPQSGQKRKKATFDVFRSYLDGEEAEGWSRWQVKNVYIFFRFPNDSVVELIPEYINSFDHEPIWGTRVS